MAKKYVCNKCGSDNIEVRAWISPNENKIVEWCEDCGDCWCNDCDETTRVEIVEQ